LFHGFGSRSLSLPVYDVHYLPFTTAQLRAGFLHNAKILTPQVPVSILNVNNLALNLTADDRGINYSVTWNQNLLSSDGEFRAFRPEPHPVFSHSSKIFF